MEKLTKDKISSKILSEILHKTKPEQTGKQMKYLIICGATMSGVGKGVTISSLGQLLKACGMRVTFVKIDPYLNIDAGLMNPYEHGECFVLKDGSEVDLDLGNYERAMGITLTTHHNITSGKIFKQVIDKERHGKYLGKTVQMVPHVTNEIKEMIIKASKIPTEEGCNEEADICLVEIGGTVGDLESSLYYEAIRQFTDYIGKENICICLISWVPQIGEDHKEPKTKPTQHGIKDLKSMGIFPDFLICRSVKKLDIETLKKIAAFSNIKPENSVSCYNVDNIFTVPLLLAADKLHLKVLDHFKLVPADYKVMRYIRLAEHHRALKDEALPVRIAICGKYINTTDQYYSLWKSIEYAACAADRKIEFEWLDCVELSEKEENEADEKKRQEEYIPEFWRKIEKCHGILVPGGTL
jgi:CTP synthase